MRQSDNIVRTILHYMYIHTCMYMHVCDIVYVDWSFIVLYAMGNDIIVTTSTWRYDTHKVVTGLPQPQAGQVCADHASPANKCPLYIRHVILYARKIFNFHPLRESKLYT